MVSETYNIILYYVSSFLQYRLRKYLAGLGQFNLLKTCSYTEIVVEVTIFRNYMVSFFLFWGPI